VPGAICGEARDPYAAARKLIAQDDPAGISFEVAGMEFRRQTLLDSIPQAEERC